MDMGTDRGKGSPAQGIHVMAKPIGPVCNLNCEYCFYLEKQALFGVGENYRMSDRVLSAYITKYIASQPTPSLTLSGRAVSRPFLGSRSSKK